jgi:hypothetical protein
MELTKAPRFHVAIPYRSYAWAEHMVYPLPLPQTLRVPYLVSCNVPTATFTAWNTAQSI